MSRRVDLPIAGAVLATIVACLVPAQAAQAQGADSLAAMAALLHPGDIVRITVWRQPELSGEFRVLPDGTIGHPLYQAVSAVNATLPEVRERVRQFLTSLVNDPQVVVEPLLSVAVGGEVRTPGLFTLPLGTTVSQAIAQAGGGGDAGTLKRIRLIRDQREQIIDLTDAAGNRGSMPVRSGDQIFVSRRGNVFRDVIGPLASVLAAAAAIITVSRQ